MLLKHLSPRAAEAGYRVQFFDCLDSTNVLAIEFAKSGDPGFLWVTANKQIAGRGRCGRSWISISGNFYATLLLVDEFQPAHAATLGFVAGVSLIEAFSLLLPESVLATYPIRLKWPNDVLADKAKLAGILLDFVSLGERKSAIVIGIGVNVAASPSDLSYSVTSLKQIGAACSAADLFRALSHVWVDNYRIWDHAAGIEVIREKWLCHAANLGEHVRIVMNGEVVSGTFETIDNNCHFILRQDNGKEIAISAGDVHFGIVSSANICS
ncbi:MAG: biotin operon repressor / biotin-[acetyl-CoA-carboxylase] ligase [Candidatus Tokpelaia sp. JSC188]|nr:MAG: biotin operon repressor / biotin-[acetyl-CoA-carboxylase] ligase [Candidatus Tokpelaia sp. JSC188]